MTSSHFTRDRLLTLLLLIAVGGLIGISTIFVKLAAGAGVPALPYLAWSVTGATVLLLALARAKGRRLRLDLSTLRYFLLAGLVSLALPNFLLYGAIPHVGAGFVALSMAFPPLYTYLAAVLLRLERFDRWRAAGVMTALAGGALIAGLKLAESHAPGAGLWVVAALAAPLVLAVGNIYRTVCWPKGARAEDLAPGMLGGAALLLMLAGLLPGQSLQVPTATATPGLLVALQAVTFALQYALFFELQRRGGPVYLSLLGSVAAIVGVPIAVLVLGEDVPRGLAPGTLLIAAGIAVVTLRQSVPTEPSSRA